MHLTEDLLYEKRERENAFARSKVKGKRLAIFVQNRTPSY